MVVLDDLLARLQREGHRVLIYSQMTRMIDLLEEYMAIRKYTYRRLDGSCKISERRDMVADFQTRLVAYPCFMSCVKCALLPFPDCYDVRTDIFAFLLSTRAGGLGINLTAADTVIFFDSDWNPTVDQQARFRTIMMRVSNTNHSLLMAGHGSRPSPGADSPGHRLPARI